MRKFGAIALLLVAGTVLASCRAVECAVLCERFVAEGMHNPKTREKVLCGGEVQKGEITAAEVDEIAACVADHAAKGFVLDVSKTTM
jgi:hypothetical protein